MKNLEKLQAEKEQWITQIFWLGLEIAFIFALPAFIGAWVGKKLGGGNITGLILVGTFIFSWVIVIIRWRKINANVKDLEEKIRVEKERLKVEENTK